MRERPWSEAVDAEATQMFREAIVLQSVGKVGEAALAPVGQAET